MPEPRNPSPGRAASPRSAARLAAVQAVYRLEMADAPPRAVIAEFTRYWLEDQRGDGGEELVAADAGMFAEIVTGTVDHMAELDSEISRILPSDWPLERLETVLRAILRVGAFELAHRVDVPARVVITEYVDVAHAFFAGKEPGMVNGVLDRLAHQFRVAEMNRDRPG